LPIYNAWHIIKVTNIAIQAGHFKPNNTYIEHGLLIYNISGQVPKIEIFKHGKRRRVTLLIKTVISSI
jgi:hypothetical protein